MTSDGLTVWVFEPYPDALGVEKPLPGDGLFTWQAALFALSDYHFLSLHKFLFGLYFLSCTHIPLEPVVVREMYCTVRPMFVGESFDPRVSEAKVPVTSCPACFGSTGTRPVGGQLWLVLSTEKQVHVRIPLSTEADLSLVAVISHLHCN